MERRSTSIAATKGHTGRFGIMYARNAEIGLQFDGSAAANGSRNWLMDTFRNKTTGFIIFTGREQGERATRTSAHDASRVNEVPNGVIRNWQK